MCFATWAYRLTFSILVWATTAIITPPPSSLLLAHIKYTKQFFLNALSGICVQFGSGKSTGSGAVVSGGSKSNGGICCDIAGAGGINNPEGVGANEELCSEPGLEDTNFSWGDETSEVFAGDKMCGPGEISV